MRSHSFREDAKNIQKLGKRSFGDEIHFAIEFSR
jgi:hypothetical protein